MECEVGKGAFATVRLEVADDGTQVAVKTYEHKVEAGAHRDERQKMHDMHVANEVRLAGRLHHPHIICPKTVRVGPLRTELTMEYAPHGTLEAYARQRGPCGVSEFDGGRLFGQVLAAVDHLHRLLIVHRDIKLENVVLDGRWDARLIDFGGAQRIGMGERLSVLQGTPGYMAPEVLTVASTKVGDVDAMAADMWSAGVTLFCLFNAAELPFTGKDVAELIRNVHAKPTPRLSHVGNGCAQLMDKLLTKAPTARLTAAAAMKHAWVDPRQRMSMVQPRALTRDAGGGPSHTSPHPHPSRAPTRETARPSQLAQPKYSPRPPSQQASARTCAVGTRETNHGAAPGVVASASARYAPQAGARGTAAHTSSCEFCASMSCRSSLFP